MCMSVFSFGNTVWIIWPMFANEIFALLQKNSTMQFLNPVLFGRGTYVP
jgi:hypothetical protein